MKYTDMVREDNPRYRMREVGGQALSNSEALAVALWITDSEQADKLAKLYREYGGLSKIPRHRILEIKGLGERYADALSAVVELARREVRQEMNQRQQIHIPSDIADLLMVDMMQLENEQMRVVLLNIRGDILKVVTVVQGSKNCVSIPMGKLFREAVRENAASVVLVHNHPSGHPDPSPEDIGFTRTAVQAGKMLDIKLLDHVIIGHNSHVSLNAQGYVRL